MRAKKIVKKQAKTKASSPKLSDEDQVKAFMSNLNHPLKAEIEAVRIIIKKTNTAIGERIKWNAPSYYYKGVDMVTFNPRATEHVHLVFHHPAIEQLKSDVLHGDYKGRRMAYFVNMKEVKANAKALTEVVQYLLTHIDRKS